MGKLVSNYLFTVVYQLFLMLTPFITTPYISRVLQPKGVGIDAYVMSVVQLFLVFAILSIPLYGSRQVASKKNQLESSKEFWSIYIFQLIVSIMTLVVYLIYVSKVSEYKILFLIHIFSLVTVTIDVSWYFIGKEQIKSVTVRNIIVKLLGIILIFSLVKDYEDLLLYIIINIVTLLAGQFIMWFPLLKEVKYDRVNFDDIKKHVIPIISLFIPQLLIQVYVLANKVVLGKISGEIEVGYYNQANKIIRLALGIVTSLGTVMLPRMASEFAKGNIQQIKTYTSHTIQFVLIITLPMTLGMMAIAPNFVAWFLGDEFSSVSLLIIIMSPVIFFVGLANIFGLQILIPTNQQNKYSFAVIIGAVLSLITNFILIYPLGSIGTTIALVVAEVVGACILMYFARSYFEMTYFFKLFIRYAFLSLLVFISISLLGNTLKVPALVETFIQLAIGVSIYALGLIVLKDSMATKVLDVIRKKFIMRG